MYMSYTFFSRILEAEETVTMIVPDMHGPTNKQYTIKGLHNHEVRLPVVFAMGDEGTSHDWWLRNSYAEADINAPETSWAGIFIRGMSLNEKSLEFIRDELPALLCALFPFDRNLLTWFSWQRSGAFAEKLTQEGPYRKVVCGGMDAIGVECMPSGDCAQAMQQALSVLCNK